MACTRWTVQTSKSVTFKTIIVSSIAGKEVYVDETQISNPRVLFVVDHNTCVYNLMDNESIPVSTEDCVYSWNCITWALLFGHFGRVTAIQNNKVNIMRGQP